MTPMMKPILLVSPLLAALLLTAAMPAVPALAQQAAETNAEPENGAAAPDQTEAEESAPPEGLRILDAAGVDPDDFLWEWRILAVMADTPNDPAFLRQMREIEERQGDLFERDVVVLVDSSRNSGSILRQRLRPRGFMLAIIDKDGEVKQRRPAPRDVRELNAVIDRFPLRRQEILERLPSGR